jgi:hypothetical protein
MDKDQFPLFAELTLNADAEDSGARVRRRFAGTDNPRYLRVIQALMLRPRKREEIDRIAGASNGPDLIDKLRQRGLKVQCKRTPGIDRDGRPIRFGIYEFNDEDRRAVNAWLRRRTAKVRV